MYRNYVTTVQIQKAVVIKLRNNSANPKGCCHKTTFIIKFWSLTRSLRCACVYIAAGGWITVHKCSPELNFSLFCDIQGTKSVSYSLQKFYQQIGLDLAALLFSLWTRQTRC